MPETCSLPGNRTPDARPVQAIASLSDAPTPDAATPYAALLARAQAERRLLAVHWELTHRCNERCSHCYLPVRPPRSGPDGELSTAKCLDVLEQLAGLGALHLTFSGGEALVRQDFFTLAAAARALRLALRIFSNGLAITPTIADRIAALHPLAVEISLYGADAATHDAITRRPGSWRRTLAAFSLLGERTVPVVMKTPLMRQNVAQFAALQALAAQLGARFRYDLTITGRIDGRPPPPGHRLTGADLAAFFRSAGPAQRPHGNAEGPRRCAVGQRSLLLGADGAVYPCPEIRIAAGNVQTQRLRAIWEDAPLWHEIAALRDADLPACRGCALAERCRRCHGVALAETGSLTGAPEVACREAWARACGG